MDKQQLLLIGGVLLLAVGAIVGVALLSEGTDIAAGNYPKGAVVADDWVRGQGGKNVVLVEYSDFECPACGAYYPMVEEVVKKYAADIRFVYRHFPLPQHKSAQLASYAAEAAGLQGKFWEMHAKLFENQQTWVGGNARELFNSYAEAIGLDMERFAADLDSAAVIAKVSGQKGSGVAAGVNSTPTFYLNGEKITNPQSLEAFESLIKAAIDAAPSTGVSVENLYTLAQVTAHKTSGDCWSVVDGSVYDLTAWIAKHPGGPEAVIAMCGKDATVEFEEQHGSKEETVALLQTFRIGALVQ